MTTKKDVNQGIGLLSGYTALDLTEGGCLICGKVLADLGVRVIKIEPPGGSVSRNLGPFYHDTPHPEKIIDQLKHYIHSGSMIKLMVYHRYSWKVLWILLTYGKGVFWKLDKLIAKYSEAQTGCPVTYAYSVKDIRRLLKDFRITNIAIDHIFPYKIPDYVKYRYIKVWYFRYLPQPIFRWLEKHFGWHLCVTAAVQ